MQSSTANSVVSTRSASLMLAKDDFVVVTRRKRRGKYNTNNYNKNDTSMPGLNQDYNWIDPERLLCKLKTMVLNVWSETFTIEVFKQLTEYLTILESNDISNIVCYGLGRFSHNMASRYQLAFLLCLKKRYEKASIYIYDPLFSSGEMRVLRYLGLRVIETNEEGKRVIEENGITLMFLPHCSRQLTNNFLYANWGKGLSNCILLANSLSYISYMWMNWQVERFGYIMRILPYVTECQIPEFELEDKAFNGLSLHIFPKQELLKVPNEIWNFKEEPKYLRDDQELITVAESNNIEHNNE
ncbi:SRR1-like protein isoform X2 [Cardiocondyla obscurior]